MSDYKINSNNFSNNNGNNSDDDDEDHTSSFKNKNKNENNVLFFNFFHISQKLFFFSYIYGYIQIIHLVS